jgi:hypothetical protein
VAPRPTASSRDRWIRQKLHPISLAREKSDDRLRRKSAAIIFQKIERRGAVPPSRERAGDRRRNPLESRTILRRADALRSS